MNVEKPAVSLARQIKGQVAAPLGTSRTFHPESELVGVSGHAALPRQQQCTAQCRIARHKIALQEFDEVGQVRPQPRRRAKHAIVPVWCRIAAHVPGQQQCVVESGMRQTQWCEYARSQHFRERRRVYAAEQIAEQSDAEHRVGRSGRFAAARRLQREKGQQIFGGIGGVGIAKVCWKQIGGMFGKTGSLRGEVLERRMGERRVGERKARCKQRTYRIVQPQRPVYRGLSEQQAGEYFADRADLEPAVGIGRRRLRTIAMAKVKSFATLPVNHADSDACETAIRAPAFDDIAKRLRKQRRLVDRRGAVLARRRRCRREYDYGDHEQGEEKPARKRSVHTRRIAHAFSHNAEENHILVAETSCD